MADLAEVPSGDTASLYESPHLFPGQRPVKPEKRHPPSQPLKKRSIIAFVVACAAMTAVLLLPLGFEPVEYKGKAPAKRCGALVIFVAILWATDAFPPHLVAMSVPLIAVVLQVMCVPRHLRLLSENDTLLVPASYCNSTDPAPGTPMRAAQAAVVSVGSFFNPVILLFMTGFVLAVVLDKYNLSKRIADRLVKFAGRAPGRRMAFVMVLCILMSSVLNNVPAAVLGASLMRPSFSATKRTSWPRYSLLGVAYSCNIGGMISPIASPQNVIAVIALNTATHGKMNLSFVDWFAVAIPFCTVCTVVTWLYLKWYYGADLPSLMPIDTSDPTRPDGDELDSVATSDADASIGSSGATATARRVRGRNGAASSEAESLLGSADGSDHEEKVVDDNQSTVRDVVIITTILITVGLWVAFDSVKGIFGNMGVVALLPILLFGGLGYVTKDDFNSLSWDTLMLLGGGLSLGTAVDSSGLLLVIGDKMQDTLSGASPFVVLLAFSTLVAILANFISSTVSAVLLLPVIATVGYNTGHGKMLVMLCVFMTSGAMGLPVSSFPNANTSAIRYERKTVVETGEFIKTGFPVSIMVLILVNTVGFGLCLAFGF